MDQQLKILLEEGLAEVKHASKIDTKILSFQMLCEMRLIRFGVYYPRRDW